MSYVALDGDCGELLSNLLEDEREITLYRQRLRQLWRGSALTADGDGGEFRFPGSTPISLDRGSIPSLVGRPYIASLKADGVRYLLMLTVDATGVPIALLIDRRMHFREICMCGETSFFQLGTVLDGELVQSTTGGHMFLVFDTITSAGDDVTHRSYSQRMATAHRIVTSKQGDESEDELCARLVHERRISAGEADVLTLEVKPWVALGDLDRLWSTRHSSLFHHDGIVFTPDCGGCDAAAAAQHTFKWKAVHTIDVAVSHNAESGHYAVRVGVPPHFVQSDQGDRLRWCDKEWSLVFVSNVVTDCLREEKWDGWDRVVECTCDINYEDQTLHFTPLQLRPDKEFGNGIHTTKCTLDNIVEKIQVEEVLSAAARLQ